MQQLYQQQHTAAPAAVSSPQHLIERPPLLAPVFAENCLSAATRGGAASSHEISSQAAVAAESLPSSATAAVAAAAAAQQQVFLAALASELRDAIDRWCPVGRAAASSPATGAAASSASVPHPHAASGLSSSAVFLLCQDDGEEQLLRLQQPHSANGVVESLDLPASEETRAASAATEHVKGSSGQGYSSAVARPSWGAAAPREETGGLAAFSCGPAALAAATAPASESEISSVLRFSWGKPPRCLHSCAAVRVILRSAVRLPTHLYREEATIEEEEAAGFLGCLEDDGPPDVQAGGTGRKENGHSYVGGEPGTLGAASFFSSRTREIHKTGEAVREFAAPRRQRSDGSCSSGSSTEELPHRWGEWPLRMSSAEDVQECLKSAAGAGDSEGVSRRSSTAADVDAAAAAAVERAALQASAGNASEISDSRGKPATAEKRSSSRRRAASCAARSEAAAPGGEAAVPAGEAAVPAGEAAAPPGEAAATGRPENVSCCWETPDTFFENTPALQPKARRSSRSGHAAVAAAAAAAPGEAGCVAGDLKPPRSPPPAPAPLPALGAAAGSKQQPRSGAAEQPPFPSGSTPADKKTVELASTATGSTTVAETDAGAASAESAAAAAFAGAEGVRTELNVSLSLVQALPAEKKPAGTWPRAGETATERERREPQCVQSLIEHLSAARREHGGTSGQTGEEFAAATRKGKTLLTRGTGGDGARADVCSAAAAATDGSRGAEVSPLRPHAQAAAAEVLETLQEEGSTGGGGGAALLAVNSDYPFLIHCGSFLGEKTEGTQFVQQALETPALQLGKNCVAVLRSERGEIKPAAAAVKSDSNLSLLQVPLAESRVRCESNLRNKKTLTEEADAGQEASESPGKKKNSSPGRRRRRSSSRASGRITARSEEAVLRIASPCARSSRAWGGEKGRGKGETGEGRGGDATRSAEAASRSSSKVKSTAMSRKLQAARSSSAPSAAQRSPPRYGFSRRGGTRATSSKPLFSPRIVQRRQRLCIMRAEDPGEAGTSSFLPSPTRSTLFCADAKPPSVAEQAGQNASDADACSSVSARCRPDASTTAAECGLQSPPPGKHERAAAGRHERATRDPEEPGDSKNFPQRIPTCVLEASSQGAAGGDRAPVRSRSAAVAENGADRPPAAAERRTAAKLSAADVCRAASAPERATELARNSGHVRSEVWGKSALLSMLQTAHGTAGASEQVLLRNPAAAAAAAATKAAAAAAECRRRLFDLFSPVAPESPADATPPTAAIGDDVHQFVHVWLEGCCRRLQAIAADYAADLTSRPSEERPRLRAPPQDAAVTPVLDEAESVHALLLSSKRQVKEELKAYDAAFFQRYGRVPGRPEKEPLRPLYSHYQLLRHLLLTTGKLAEADPQPHAPASPAAAVRSCKNSSSGHVSLSVDDGCRKKGAADEKLEEARVSAEPTALAAGGMPPSVVAVHSASTAAGLCADPMPGELAGRRGKLVVVSEDVQPSGKSGLARQARHSSVRQEHRCSPRTVTGTERADGAAALPVVEWNPRRLDAGISGDNACKGVNESEGCHRVPDNSNSDAVERRRFGADATANGVKPSFTATGEGGGAVNVSNKGIIFEAGHHWQQSSQLRDEESCGDAHLRFTQRTDSETDQPPLRCAPTVAAVAGCGGGSGRSETSFTPLHVAGSNSASDVPVHVRTSRSRTMSAKPEISPAGLSVRSEFATRSHRDKDKSCTMRETLCQEFHSNRANIPVIKAVHQERIPVIGGQSFSNVCAARRPHTEHCFVENSCAENMKENVCDFHANEHDGKNKRLLGNKCDSPRMRECRTRDISVYSYHHQQLSTGAPARVENIGVGTADAVELTVNVRSQQVRQEDLSVGKAHTCVGSRKATVTQPMKILTSRVNAEEVMKQRATELMPQSAVVRSQMENMHKPGLPFLASAANEYQQRLVRLQQEKRMLRTKLLAYQAEFTAETGRVVQLYKDIAPIEREYRRYKEVKQEIARLIDKQYDSLFSTEEPEAHCQTVEEDGIPSEKFDKGRQEVCAS